MSGTAEQAAPAAKPNPMRLRPDPPQVTRLSRKALLGLAAVAGVAIAAALFYALQTRTPDSWPEDLAQTDRQPPAEQVMALPQDYTGPILGPPLPGDLGKPVLEAQKREAADMEMPASNMAMAAPPVAVDAAEQQRLAEQQTARTSSVFIAGNQSAASGAPETAAVVSAQSSTTAAAEDSKAAFLNAPVDRRTMALDRALPPASPYLLQAGAVIPAALITGIRSDLPGQISAQVTQNVYDSVTGQYLLIPQGARLLGEYASGVSHGQQRLLLVWTRLLFPDGRSLVLERQPGADAQGYAGLQDGIDEHWGGVLKAASLSTLLSVGAELAIDDDDRLLRALRNGGQNTLNDAGQQIIQRQLQVSPTLTIRPGFPVRVIVTKDLPLDPIRRTP